MKFNDETMINKLDELCREELGVGSLNFYLSDESVSKMIDGIEEDEDIITNITCADPVRYSTDIDSIIKPYLEKYKKSKYGLSGSDFDSINYDFDCSPDTITISYDSDLGIGTVEQGEYLTILFDKAHIDKIQNMFNNGGYKEVPYFGGDWGNKNDYFEELVDKENKIVEQIDSCLSVEDNKVYYLDDYLIAEKVNVYNESDLREVENQLEEFKRLQKLLTNQGVEILSISKDKGQPSWEKYYNVEFYWYRDGDEYEWDEDIHISGSLQGTGQIRKVVDLIEQDSEAISFFID